MTFIRAQVSLQTDSLDPKDVAVNVWHFRTQGAGEGTPVERDEIEAALTGFYGAIGVWFSENIGPTNHRLKMYDLEDPPPRAPLTDNVFSLGSIGPGALPNEVAVCLSMRGPLGSGVDRRRNRGRLYLGPLTQGAAVDAAGDVRPAIEMRQAIVDAVNAWLLPVATGDSGRLVEWSIFSRYDALGLPPGAPAPSQEPTYTNAGLHTGFKEVVTAWVDNAFDTQRRRGLAPTGKTFA